MKERLRNPKLFIIAMAVLCLALALLLFSLFRAPTLQEYLSEVQTENLHYIEWKLNKNELLTPGRFLEMLRAAAETATQADPLPRDTSPNAVLWSLNVHLVPPDCKDHSESMTVTLSAPSTT